LDDPLQNNTLPYKVQSLDSTFSFIPTLNNEEMYTMIYNGILNRSLTKNLTVTLNASDNKGYFQISTIPIIVGDIFNTYPISDGFKTINIIYVDGYINSLRDISLGTVFVNDLDDWFHVNRTYIIRDVSNGQIFNVSQGLLRTSEALYPGSYKIRTSVTKPGVSSTALSTIDLSVTSVDSESVRLASTIRIRGKK
jgi:hypothetical protein